MQTKFLLLLIAIISVVNLQAQQLDTPTLYRYNWQVFNPAAIDITQIVPNNCSVKNSRIILGASGRHKWIGSNFPDKPSTANFRAEVYPDVAGKGIENIKFKWGGFGVYDKAGPVRTGKFQAVLAGLIPLNIGDATHILSIGLGGGAIVRDINFSQIHFKDGLPSVLPTQSAIAPSVSAGIFYSIINKNANVVNSNFETVYFGLSIPQTFQLAPINLEDNTPYILSKRHYYFVVGAKLLSDYIGMYNSLEPSIWVGHYDNARLQTLAYNLEAETIKTFPLTADFNIRFTYDNFLWVGAGVSTNKMLHTELGINPKIQDATSQLYNISIAASFPVFWDSLLGSAIELNVTYSFDR